MSENATSVDVTLLDNERKIVRHALDRSAHWRSIACWIATLGLFAFGAVDTSSAGPVADWLPGSSTNSYTFGGATTPVTLGTAYTQTIGGSKAFVDFTHIENDSEVGLIFATGTGITHIGGPTQTLTINFNDEWITNSQFGPTLFDAAIIHLLPAFGGSFTFDAKFLEVTGPTTTKVMGQLSGGGSIGPVFKIAPNMPSSLPSGQKFMIDGNMTFTGGIIFGDPSGTGRIPEPSMFAFLGIGGIGLIVYAWRRWKNSDGIAT